MPKKSPIGRGKKAPRKKKPLSQKEQSARFIATARKLSADETGATFTQTLRSLLGVGKKKARPRILGARKA